MSADNRSCINAVATDNKLQKYMRINRRICKQLSEQRIEIATLKNTLRATESEVVRLRILCESYKVKCDSVNDLFRTSLSSISEVLQSNVDTFAKQSEKAVDERGNLLIGQLNSISRNVDNSRRVGKSFGSVKNRWQRRNNKRLEMCPIAEDDESEQTIIDNSDGHNKESLDEETGDSGVESDVSGKESVKENQKNSKETGESEEKIDFNDEENGQSKEGGGSNKIQETNGETEGGGQQQKSKEVLKKSVNASDQSTGLTDGNKFGTESSTSTSTSSSGIASSRPRRKAAPVFLVEQKLNTKIRRPR